jgi:MFS family permease
MAKTSAVPATGFRLGAVLLLGIIGAIQVADPIISSMALAKASDRLNFDSSTQALAAGISTLALAATVIPGGLLADRIGRRLVVSLAVLVSAAGQIFTAFSQNAGMYLTGRVITGIALGMVFGGAYGMLKNVSSQKSLGPAMAMFNVTNGIIPVIAMVIGGILVGADWRLAYFVLPVVSVIAFILIPFILPKVDKVPGGKIDIFGMLFLGIGVAGILYGISQATKGVTTPAFLVPVFVGLLGLVAFVIREQRSSHPVFPIQMLKHPAFVGAVIMGIFWNFGSGAISQMLPNIWQYVTHIPTALIGIAQLPATAAGIAGSLVAGALLGRGKPARFISISGYGLLVLGFVDFVLAGNADNYIVFVPGLVIAGIGYMMNATTQGNLFLGLAPAKFFGPVSSSKLVVGQFGYSLGLTGTTTAISILTVAKVDHITKGAVTGQSNWDTITHFMTTGATDGSDTAVNEALTNAGQKAIEGAYSAAFAETAAISAVLIAIAGVLMFISLSKKGANEPVDQFLDEQLEIKDAKKAASAKVAPKAPAKATAAKTAAKPAAKAAAKPAVKKPTATSTAPQAKK